MQPLPRRQQQVLQATVRHYVDTMEPVGSQTLVRRFALDASPATVRSAMGALEQRGLLTQPHTSAGRLPSALGYRHYVDCLLPPPGAAALQLERELSEVTLQWTALEDLLDHLARRLADLTGLLSLITRPRRHEPRLRTVRLAASGDRLLVFVVESAAQASTLNLPLPPGGAGQLPALEQWLTGCLEDGADGGAAAIPWASLPPHLQSCAAPLRRALGRQGSQREGSGVLAMGVAGLLAQPEFSRSDQLRPLLERVEQTPHELLQPLCQAPPRGGVWIGGEHPDPALAACSLVQATYQARGGAEGHVALIGPMRMAYATARAAVQTVAASLERLLS